MSGRPCRILPVFIALLVFACEARWTKFSEKRNHHVPKFVYLYVAVSSQVVEADDDGAVITMVEAIEADLREEGIRTELVAAREDEAPPLPRVELQVLSSVGADREMRGAGKLAGLGLLGVPSSAVRLAAGTAVAVASVEALGSIVVDCYVLPGRDGVQTFAGRVQHDWAEDGSAEAIGHMIAEEILD